MNIEKEIVYKKIPVLKIMILIMLLISIIFQSIISWVNEEPGIRNFFKVALVVATSLTVATSASSSQQLTAKKNL